VPVKSSRLKAATDRREGPRVVAEGVTPEQ
jgi:hypothetical protein